MAEKRPFFLTGANAKIILNNRTVAFATDVSFSVNVRHATPRVLGRFEVETVQPLTYDVEGSLTIIKYARGLKDYMEQTPPGVNQKGSGPGSYGSDQGIITSALGLPSGGQFDGGAADNFNPNRFFQSKMFDIEIRQKIPIKTGSINNIGDLLGGFLNALNDALVPDGLNDSPDTTIVARLRDCRFTGLDFKLSKRGLALQTLNFRARYYDDDTGVAQKSGVGQELS
jgi:hypothetical protein